jgi:hypothetical protein
MNNTINGRDPWADFKFGDKVRLEGTTKEMLVVDTRGTKHYRSIQCAAWLEKFNKEGESWYPAYTLDLVARAGSHKATN